MYNRHDGVHKCCELRMGPSKEVQSLRSCRKTDGVGPDVTAPGSEFQVLASVTVQAVAAGCVTSRRHQERIDRSLQTTDANATRHDTLKVASEITGTMIIV